MDGTLRDGVVHVGGDARQRFYDARGYGRPLQGNEIALAPVEAAHLLFRGDLDAVDGQGFRAFFGSADRDPDFGVRFLVYADLRERGFYCSPAREDWVDDPEGADVVVYPRGKGPGDGDVAYRLRVRGERATLPLTELGGADGTNASGTDADGAALAVVDEESEITYFETAAADVSGSSGTDLPSAAAGTLVADRVVVWDPPADLYDRGFYGQPLAGRDGDTEAIQLSLVEAAFLADAGALDVSVPGETTTSTVPALVARGRDVEGERFDRRLAAYAALREAGVVPKTGFKFGADFRTYADVESADDVGHSERLVRVLTADAALAARDLALDVRLAHGVRKTMTFALVGDAGDGPPTDAPVEWVSVERLTP